ncbi:MAG: hypothetical protein HQL20_04575 [Candidatus Omnitrophica bacterium]|nr:hypothetical protein [Candidatus Omnitrophota bacterium]
MGDLGIKRAVSLIVLVVFILTSVVPPSCAQSLLQLPAVDQMVALSPAFNPAVLKGIKVYPQDPLRLDFILANGEASGNGAGHALQGEASRLIKYFLASLTIPEKDLWVNLSPYEKDRIVPEVFGQTEMGRDLLAQDYILKQVTASLLYPEGETGKKFWQRIYALAQEKYGTTDVPFDAFNKVWIVPDKAEVYENAKAGTAYVLESRLKVMLEADYLASQVSPQTPTTPNDIAKNVLREIVIPILEEEVNSGRNFAPLRQVYQSLILAEWYKRKIKDSLLAMVYVDRNKTDGVNVADRAEAEKIWSRYVEAFKAGVYNLVKEERDLLTDELIPRKYFSGGCVMALDSAMNIHTDAAAIGPSLPGAFVVRARMGGAVLDGALERQAFNEYMRNDELLAPFMDQPLREAFTPRVRQALLSDRTLRPAFMVVFDEKNGEVGPLEGVDVEALDQLGGIDLLNAHSCFLAGSPERANGEIMQGRKIIVGVTDRFSRQSLMNNIQVANGRQVYFPLPEGSWLGVKGSGDFLDPRAAEPFLVDKVAGRLWGLASEDEARRAERGRPLLEGKDYLAVQFLGYRRLNVLIDGTGNRVNAADLDVLKGDHPALIFNRVFTPHRLVKLPQLLENDPGLKQLHAAIAEVFRNNGQEAPENAGSMLAGIIRQMAVNAAFKNNNQLYKETFHLQDVLFSGHEADNEEWISYEDLLERVSHLHVFEYQPYVRHFLQTHKINLDELSFSFYLMRSLLEVFSQAPGSAELLLAARGLLEEFFSVYLAKLNDENLRAWLKEYDVIEFGPQRRAVARPLQSIFAFQHLERFHPQPSGLPARDSFEVMLRLQTMLEKESGRRGIMPLPVVVPEGGARVAPEVLLSGDYLAPGYRRVTREDEAYGKSSYPAVDRLEILRALKELGDSDLLPFMKDLSVNAREAIVLYAQGLQTAAAVQALINAELMLARPDAPRLIEIALPVVRLWAKYGMRSSINLFILQIYLQDDANETGDVPPEERDLIAVARREFVDLLNNDLPASEQVMARLNTLELGDRNTLREVDAAAGQSLGMAKGMLKGGIDFNAGKMELSGKAVAGEIKFILDPALVKMMQDASGIVPVILNIQPLKDPKLFLGLSGS